MDDQGQDLDLGAAPASDPLAGVPAEPIEDVSEAPEQERLGGDGAAIGEPSAGDALGDGAVVGEPSPEDVLQEPEEPDDEPEDVGVPAEPAELENSEEQAADEAAAAAAAEPEPEDQRKEPEPVEVSEPAAKPKGKKKKAKTPLREYKVLRVNGNNFQDALDKPVKARHGDEAIKEAYKSLSKNGEETITFVAVPMGYFKPKKVKGRERTDYDIEIG